MLNSNRKEEAMNDRMRDPVCGMQVDQDSFAIEYMEIHYAFCSQQCLDRFKATPHLYIGVPGEKAPKQQGMEEIKRRRFRLQPALTDAQASTLIQELKGMMGIKHIAITEDTVSITYDLLQATAEQIEVRIGQIGLHLDAGLGERLQRDFVHYLEECEVSNLEVTAHKGHH